MYVCMYDMIDLFLFIILLLYYILYYIGSMGLASASVLLIGSDGEPRRK